MSRYQQNELRPEVDRLIKMVGYERDLKDEALAKVKALEEANESLRTRLQKARTSLGPKEWTAYKEWEMGFLGDLNAHGYMLKV